MSGAPDGAEAARPVSEGAALAGLLRPIRGRLVAAVGVQAMASAVGVVPLVAVAELARVLLAAGPVDRHRAWLAASIGATALVARLVLLVAASVISHFAENELQLSIRRRLVECLGRVPLGWFSTRNSGGVKKAVDDDVGAMHHLVAHSLLELTAAVVAPVVSLAYLFWVDWAMTLATLVPVVVGMALFRRTAALFQKNMARLNAETERINSTAVEFVQGIAVVKTFGQSRQAHRRFADAADDFAAAFGSWVGDLIGPRAVAELVLSPVVMLLVVLVAGAVFVTNGWMAPADLVAFALLGVGLSAPVLALSYAEQDMRTGRAAAARVTDLLATPGLAVSSSPVEPVGDAVVYDRVGFSYNGRDRVLHDLDLRLDPGTVTALVGPSGAGKSTIARLLPRFWDPEDGAIRIGGVDLRQLSADQLYRRVTFVFQDVQLLVDTVENNIRLGRPDAGRAEVEAAARAAQIHDRVLALPRGYDSVVGEDALLSGGEAQRLSIARALLADAPVIVFDEAASAADPESETAVQDAVSRLVDGKTLLVIAHRLSTVTDADQIAVVADGTVVERGTHPELLSAGGEYARLWQAFEASRSWQPRPVPATNNAGPGR